VFGMIVDALILAGGRSSRLGGSDKRKLVLDGESLLRRTIRAAEDAGARSVLVVGDDSDDGTPSVREHPAFAGPVAAVAAGMRALPGSADAVAVLACDMPGIGAALPALVAGFRGDGVIALDRGRRQQLAIVVETAALTAALGALPTVADASMRALLQGLDLVETVVPDGATDDIDTWEDAAQFGIASPTGGRA
jgi:molybdopterin-guanine dinucleotide biosynthesis protein A